MVVAISWDFLEDRVRATPTSHKYGCLIASSVSRIVDKLESATAVLGHQPLLFPEHEDQQ